VKEAGRRRHPAPFRQAEIPLAPIPEKPMSRDRFEKILAVAVNPGAYEGEAIAALRKARELVERFQGSNLITRPS